MKKHFFSLFFLVVFMGAGVSTYASQNNLPRYGVVSANFDPPRTMHTASCGYFNGRLDEGADACSVLLEFPCEEDFYCHELVAFDSGNFERIIRVYGDGYTRSGSSESLGLDTDPETNPLGRLHGFYEIEYDYYSEIASANLRKLPDGLYILYLQSANFGRLSMMYFRYSNGFISVLGLYDRLSREEKELRCIPENGRLEVSLDELRQQDRSGNSFYEYVFENLCGFESSDYEQIVEYYKHIEPMRSAQCLGSSFEGYYNVGLPVYRYGRLLYFTSYLVEKKDSVFFHMSSEDPRIACYENCGPYTEITDRRSYPRDLDGYLRDVNRQAILSTADVRAMLLVIPVMTANVQHYNNIAYYLEQSGQYSESILLLNEVVAAFPNRTVAYINLGDAYWGLEQHTEAREAYQTYIRLMRENNREQRIPQRVFDRVGD